MPHFELHRKLPLIALLSLSLLFSAGCQSDDNEDTGSAGPAGGNGSGGIAASGGIGGLDAGASGGSGALTSSGGSGGTAPDAGSLDGSAGFAGAVAGTPGRPQLTDTQAADYTILRYLQKAGRVTALSTDDWDPTAGVGDVGAFTATYTVAPSGGTHTTVQAAIDAAVAAGGTNRVYIRLSPNTYREVVCVPVSAPAITLYGENVDASQTVIANNNYNSKPKPVGQPANPCNPSLSSSTYGTSGSATFAAYAAGFQAKNLTFANDTDETGLSRPRHAGLRWLRNKVPYPKAGQQWWQPDRTQHRRT